MSIYKIKNDKGLFSTGGECPDWTKTGKVWRNIGGVKSHLRLLRDRMIYDDCSIVEYEIIEKSIMPIGNIIKEQKDKDLKEEIELSNYIKKQKEKEEREMLSTLKSKYE